MTSFERTVSELRAQVTLIFIDFASITLTFSLHLYTPVIHIAHYHLLTLVITYFNLVIVIFWLLHAIVAQLDPTE